MEPLFGRAGHVQLVEIEERNPPVAESGRLRRGSQARQARWYGRNVGFGNDKRKGLPHEINSSKGKTQSSLRMVMGITPEASTSVKR